MFDIGWSELVVIAVVAVVVIGPKDLPRALRSLGRWTARTKSMAREFQNQFNEALREAELDSVKKQVDDLARIDPMAGIRADLAKTQGDIMTGLKVPPPGTPAAVTATPAAATVAPAPAAVVATPMETPAAVAAPVASPAAAPPTAPVETPLPPIATPVAEPKT